VLGHLESNEVCDTSSSLQVQEQSRRTMHQKMQRFEQGMYRM
jgi:hypothetical protein